MFMPIYPDDFFAGNYELKEVSHANHHLVPTTFFFLENDTNCPVELNKRIYDDITAEKHMYIQPFYGHHYPAWIQGDTFLSKIVAAIETGDPARASEF